MRNKKKIAIIGLKGLPAFGGAASVGEALLNEIKEDYDFTVYAISTHAFENNFNGINQIIFKEKKISGFSTLKYYVKSLFHCLFFEKYDLIHLHHSESGFITPFLRLKYIVILTLHGVFLNKYDPKFNKIINHFFRFSEKMNIKFANVIVSVSKTDQEFIKKNYKRDCIYIPNGVNKQEINITNQKKQFDFLFIAARIYEIKGLHILLEAIKKHKIDSKLLVIGDLNQDEGYKKKIMELSEELNIQYIPLIREKYKLFEYISKSKIFVFPSLFEAMSMTLLEVVAHQIPVLSSDIQSVKNIFNENDVTFFESYNSDDLAEKLIFCLNNGEIINRRSRNAYSKVVEKFTWDKIAEEYKVIYNELMSV